MPFDRYLEDNDYSQEYEYTSHASSSSSQPYRGPGQVRLQIPQFMSSGAPMLAPGGGAEILPAGMFTNASQSGMSSSWYANNGLTGGFSLHSSSDVYMPSQDSFSHSNGPVPIHYIRSPLDALSPRSATTTSSYDYDNGPANTNTNTNTDPKESSQSALSLYTNSGLASAHHYSNHLNAIASANSSPSFGVSVPSPLGLPVYSTTGFDLLSVLARVATRPNPQVALGPVDLTSSFAVVDVRRYDHPIIYCSPTFCRLTGYDEQDILGKNCRFLQSPDGIQPKGEIRRFTSHDAVVHMKKHLAADKEVQTSIVNYRKNGEAFINLITIIPIRGGDIGMPSEDDKVVYHVGFQVDLNTQPQDIMQKVKDGSYIPNYTANDPVAIVPPMAGSTGSMHGLVSRDRKLHTIPAPIMSQQLKKLLEDRNFMTSFPITTVTNSESSVAQTNSAAATATSPTSASPPDAASSSGSASELGMGPTGNHPLSLILLEYAPDFIHIVSLKGSFLYVAPSVKRILGYHPSELVGKSLSDICHPADSIPLMRELKESSATGPTALGSAGTSSGEDPKYYSNKPRPVDLLFRARTKEGKYVWVECRGRLHVEPGKGRKAIMLSGRAKEMSNFKWSAVASTGGLSRPRLVMGREDRSSKGSTPSSQASSPGPHEKVTEFWGTITRAGILLVVGNGCKDVLGWDELELIGRPIWNFLTDDDKKRRVGEELISMGCAVGSTDAPGSLPSKLHCRMAQHSGAPANVELVLYPSSVDSDILKSTHTITPAPIIYQVKLYDPPMAGPAALVHPLDENIFKELETSRGTSWQYELQQLKFANDRLKEEIKGLEGGNGLVAGPGQLLSFQSQKQQEMSSVATQSPQTQHPSSAVGLGALTGSLGGNYDHQPQHHHQGLGSGSFNSVEQQQQTQQLPAVGTSTPQSHMYNSPSYKHSQSAPNWSAVGSMNVNPMPGVPIAVAMPMQYVSPQQQQQMMHYNTSNANKRSWDSVDHGGPA